jgi:hypothetical protein
LEGVVFKTCFPLIAEQLKTQKTMKKTRVALLAVFFFGLLLFNHPFLSIPNGLILGIPSLIVYIFGAWIFLVAAKIFVLFPRNKTNKPL